MISVSALSSYSYCQRKLYLQYVLKFFEPMKEATIKGSIRHKIYEAINEKEESIVISITKKLDFEQIRRLYELNYTEITREAIRKNKNSLAKFNVKPEDLFKSVWPLIKDESETRAFNILGFIQLNKIYGKELWEKLTPKIISEQRISSDKLGLRGIVDQIEVYEKGMVPIELKTGSCPKEGVWPNHKIQLAAYSLLLEEHHNTQVKEGFITYLDTKQRRHISINPFLREEVLELIKKVKSLLSGKIIPDFEKNQNKCNKCGIKEHCFNQKTIEKRMRELQLLGNK